MGRGTVSRISCSKKIFDVVFLFQFKWSCIGGQITSSKGPRTPEISK